MKSFRWTLIFAGLVAVLLAFTIFDFKRSEKQEVQKQKEANVLRIPTEEVVGVEVTNRISKTELKKEGDTWKVVAPFTDSADMQAVQTLLASLAGEKIQQVVAEGPGASLATYGLDQPVNTLTITAKDGRKQVVKIGSVKAFDDNLYAQIDNEQKALLVGPTWDLHLSKQAREYRDKHLFRGGDTQSVKRFQIRMPGEAETELEKQGESWRVVRGDPFGSGAPVSSDKVSTYLETLKALLAVEVLNQNKTDKTAFTQHRLDKPSLEVKLFKEGREPFYTFTLGSSEKKDELNFAAIASDREPIFKVHKSASDGLKRRAQDFYDKKKPFAFSVADVGRIKIESPAFKGEFLLKGDSWVAADAGLQKELDQAKLKGLLEKLNGLEAVRVLAPAGKGPSRLKDAAKVALLKTTGELVFEFEWGSLVKEKPVRSSPGDQPEFQYLLARTNLSDRMIGVPEASVRGLELEQLYKAPSNVPETAPKPAISPAAP